MTNSVFPIIVILFIRPSAIITCQDIHLSHYQSHFTVLLREWQATTPINKKTKTAAHKRNLSDELERSFPLRILRTAQSGVTAMAVV